MGCYDRGADSVEFGRFVTLTDGVFAIALTLLVLDLALPDQAAALPLAQALAETGPRFFAFVISVAVVGTFFLSHHEFVAMLQKVDGGLLGLSIPYLGLIVLIPFAQSVLGEGSGEPLAYALYGALLGCTSIAAAMMLWHAHRRGLLREPLTGREARLEVARTGVPIVVFGSSAGFALVIGGWVVLFWVAIWPIDAVLARFERRAV